MLFSKLITREREKIIFNLQNWEQKHVGKADDPRNDRTVKQCVKKVNRRSR